MEVLVTICARKGSEGLQGKNIKQINGKPLICWTAGQAISWEREKDIAISTDIEAIIERYKTDKAVNIVNRSMKLAQSNVPKMLAIKDCVTQMEKRRKGKYQTIVDIDVCNPLRKDDDITKAFDQFKRQRPKTLFSVTRSFRNPYFNMVEASSGIKRCKPKPDGAYRRQDVPYVYDMNNSIFIYDRDWLMADKTNDPISERTEIFVMEDWQRFDIDDAVDFSIVEFILRQRG